MRPGTSRVLKSRVSSPFLRCEDREFIFRKFDYWLFSRTLDQVKKVSITRDLSRYGHFHLPNVSNLQREVHANAIQKAYGKIPHFGSCSWAIVGFVAHTDLELEHFWRTIGVDGSHPANRMRIAKALVPINHRNHGTVNERLEVVVDTRSNTE